MTLACATSFFPAERTLELLKAGSRSFEAAAREAPASPKVTPALTGPLDAFFHSPSRPHGSQRYHQQSHADMLASCGDCRQSMFRFPAEALAEGSSCSGMDCDSSAAPTAFVEVSGGREAGISSASTSTSACSTALDGERGNATGAEPLCHVCARRVCVQVCSHCELGTCGADVRACDRCGTRACTFCTSTDFEGAFDRTLCPACTSTHGSGEGSGSSPLQACNSSGGGSITEKLVPRRGGGGSTPPPQQRSLLTRYFSPMR